MTLWSGDERQFDIELTFCKVKRRLTIRIGRTARRHFKLCVEQRPTAKLKAALLLLRACPLVLTALDRLRRF